MATASTTVPAAPVTPKRRFHIPSSNKFHLFVSTTTIAAMYWIITHLSSRFPHLEKVSLQYRLLIIYLGSAGFYQLLALGLSWLYEHNRLLRRLVLGPEYVEGTWIGCYRNPQGQKKFTVEHFDQTLDGVVIRGYAFNDDDTEYGKWLSTSVSINAAQGVLTYSYDCQIFAAKNGFQGLAVFTFIRKRPGSPPRGMSGYSADLVDGIRSPNGEVKYSHKQVDWLAALQAAKKQFP
jgi:hypothetical protein